MDFQLILLFFISGVIGGFLAGLLGVGGGVVFVPVIQYFIKDKVADDDFVAYTIANSLFIIFIVGVFGWYEQLKVKNTDSKTSLIVGFTAVITSLITSYLIKEFNITDKRIFNSFFTILIILTVVRMLMSYFLKQKDPEKVVLPSVKYLMPIGFITGAVTALTGLGGGVIMVPYFNKVLKLPIKFSTGLSLSIIPIIALPLIVFYLIIGPKEIMSGGFQTGYIMWQVVLPIGFIAAFSAKYGVKFAQKRKPQTILLIFIVFVSLTLLKVWLA